MENNFVQTDKNNRLFLSVTRIDVPTGIGYHIDINTCKHWAVNSMVKKVTRNDVARLAGVSPAVVSYVLSNSNYVSKEKREAVLRAAKELNYSPNLFAKGLRTNRSFSIALVGDSLQEELFGPLSVQLLDNGFYSSLFYSQIKETFIQRIIDGRFDAVFMTSNGFTAQQLNRIVESGTPVLLYKSRNYPDLSEKIVAMAPDFFDGVLQAMRYLIGKGHRHIGYVPPLHYRTNGFGGDDFRIQAYEKALEENNLRKDPNYICCHTECFASIEADVKAMLQLPPEQRVTALVVGDDHLAAKVMQSVRSWNLSIPKDLAVVGWGNISSASITTPQLTTVDASITSFAHDVVRALVTLANGQPLEEKVYPVHLVIREST